MTRPTPDHNGRASEQHVNSDAESAAADKLPIPAEGIPSSPARHLTFGSDILSMAIADQVVKVMGPLSAQLSSHLSDHELNQPDELNQTLRRAAQIAQDAVVDAQAAIDGRTSGDQT
jgi:hypothetical protein